MKKKQRPAPAPVPPPPAPDHLDDSAKATWTRTVSLLASMILAKTGAPLLATVDLDALALYCQAYARWQDAEKHIAQDGPIVRAPSGYPVQNPYVAIGHKAAEQARRLGDQFGLTPRSRQKLGVQTAGEA